MAVRGPDGRQFLDLDIIYSVFGALEFTPPEDILPLAASALRPGGRLVVATRHPAWSSPTAPPFHWPDTAATSSSGAPF